MFLYIRERLWVSCPCNQLLRCDEVDIGESQDGVNELEETILAVRSVEEPGGVEEEREGSLALGVVLQEVLREDLLDRVSILVVEASISHGA